MLLVADTSVLINFLRIDAMHLIGRHRPACAVTEHVIQEVTSVYPQQQERLQAAIEAGYLADVITVSEPEEVELFARLQKPPTRLGVGESSAIALAIHRGYALAVDDRRAARNAQGLAAAEGVELEVMGTPDIIVRLIQAGQLTVKHADVLLVSWRTHHRFRIAINSFSEWVARNHKPSAVVD